MNKETAISCEIKRTIIPFRRKIRLEGEDIATELYNEIQKVALKYDKDPHDFSAEIRMAPIPDSDGHYVHSEVIYEHGQLTPPAEEVI